MTASVSNWVGLGSLLLLAACGGRTSTLTDDNEPFLGSSVPGSSAGGAAGSSSRTAPPSMPAPSSSPVGPGVMFGGGGVPGTGMATGVAGSTSAGGAMSSGGSPAIAPACADFCKRAGSSPCADDAGIGTGSCADDCTRALGGEACAPSAKAVLDCYSQVFTANATRCAMLEGQLGRRCDKQAQAFKNCSE
ncbi:MAG: hypothetical protein ABJB12_21505, partial [Pseudomonadota bacterium]